MWKLETIMMDVIHERRHVLIGRPARVAETCDERIVARFGMRPRVLGQKAKLGDGVVADENDEAPGRERDAEVSRAAGAGIRLRSKGDPTSLRENALGVIRRSVIDDDDFELGRILLM